METKRDYYEVLGVNREAEEGAIKKAYRKLAKKYHPDTNAGNAQAEQRFKEITEAYTVLSDPKKRKLYDQFGHAAFDGSGPQEGAYYRNAGNTGNGGYREYHFEGGDMDDIFGDIFGDMFHGKNSGGFGKRGFGGREFSGRGSDVEADVAVSFDEAVFGGDKVIHLRDQDGNVQSLQVHIPAGIEAGKTIRLRGKGNPGINGGGSGDLLLRVTVGEKPGYERKGRDIYTTVQIPYTTAVFGGEARVKTIHGEVICKIREGTQSGSKIRLRGKGVVSMKNPSQYGDQYVTVLIQVPKNLSAEAKQKLREFEKLASQSSNGMQHRECIETVIFIFLEITVFVCLFLMGML